MDGQKIKAMARSVGQLLKDTASEWKRDKSPRMAAALAFYTVFSIAPLVMIAVSIAGFVISRETVQDRIFTVIQSNMGEKAAGMVKSMIAGVNQPSSGILATAGSLLLILYGASRIFIHLRDALNTIWDVLPEPGKGIRKALLDRVVSFLMVFGTGVFLIIALFLTTAFSAVLGSVRSWLPGFDPLWLTVDYFADFVITTVIFAVIFKILPGTKIRWGDVWIGAVLTTVLFATGRFFLGLYFRLGFMSSIYGAAGSLIIILLWVYFSTQILLLGAEFTHSFAHRFGSKRPLPEEEKPPPGPEPDLDEGSRDEEATEPDAGGLVAP